MIKESCNEGTDVLQVAAFRLFFGKKKLLIVTKRIIGVKKY
jgi:hypothetical protein